MKDRVYLCIDLKSFYASVECVDRGLDPMTTNLVVADESRSEKTICLAVSPSLKAKGVPGRCRLFEIPKNLEYLIAPPRMARYIEYAADIYSIYLKYISKEDIYVYSIDEAFMDVTDYLSLYGLTARELGQRIMKDIFDSLGVRSACGIGPNLYLTKIALDITAKHAADFIGELDEDSYRAQLWDHRPLTDFWRIGKGIARRLESHGIRTMREITEADEGLIYRLFGVDAELLIDHAWGREPTTIRDIKNYHVKTNSLTSGQVMGDDYDFAGGELIVKEMMDLLCLEMVEKNLVTRSVTLHVGYSNRFDAKPAHGTTRFEETNADMVIIPAVVELYRRIVDPAMPIKRFYLTCNDVIPEEYRQYSFFADEEKLEKNRKLQKAVLEMKKKYGRDAVMKGMNLDERATTKERLHQIGGHRSGE